MSRVFWMLVLAACSPAATKVEVESGAYAADLNACVVAAKTIEESKECRARVREEYRKRHGLPLDGGAP